jgi:hypothetical protein
MAEKSRTFLNFGLFKGEFSNESRENTNPRKVEKSQIWFVDIKRTDNFELTRRDFFNEPQRKKKLTLSRLANSRQKS